MEAMVEENESLSKNKTWELTELPKGKKPIGCKWVFKKKESSIRKRRGKIQGTIDQDLELEQLDVKTAFLHGNLEEEIFMVQPEGFKQPGTENLVCRLKKSLYGLKQSPRQWYKRLKSLLHKEFEMKDLGAAKKILGMEIRRDRGGKKAVVVSEKLHQEVGCLMYAMVCTRPDLAHAVSTVSRYMANPGREHWNAVKWIFRYLKGTAEHGILFSRQPGTNSVVGYVDADYAVAMSTTEAEYMAVAEAAKEALWLKGLVKELGLNQGGVQMHCDSQSAIYLAKNQACDSPLGLWWRTMEEKFVRLDQIQGQGGRFVMSVVELVNQC
uniref:Reverse transcriptase Ty1/copia-type domain-containing protein n=1 Tax=Fagus sylvatica TaxID=28930 RepID=A0A2N9GPK2_FAGSY